MAARQIEKQYQDILANGGIPMPETVPENFGGFQPVPPPPAPARCSRCAITRHRRRRFNAWRETNVRPQKQPGYAIVTVMRRRAT